MNAPTQTTTTQAPATQAPAKANPLVVVRDQIVARQNEFAMALPAHIPAARFVRMAVTAIQTNPALAHADRPSLMSSCMKAAQDGLVLDGREAALVIYKSKVKGRNGAADTWEDKVQYMPMVAGIMKKARNSGEISSLTAHVVYEKDTFRYVLGDDERVEHIPFLEGDRGKARAVYAIARLKDGGVQRDVMSASDVERIRGRSKAKDSGPWVTDWSEMARKTIIRRLSKYLPASTDKETGQNIIDIVSRDDDLYEHENAPADLAAPDAVGNGTKAPRKPRGAAAKIIDTQVIENGDQPVDGQQAGQQQQQQSNASDEPPLVDADGNVIEGDPI